MIEFGMRDGIADVVHKLTILVVGDLRVIHEKPHNGNLKGTLHVAVEDILIRLANVKGPALDVLHPIRIDTRVFGTIQYTHELSALLCAA
jgi:hypothetical protein